MSEETDLKKALNRELIDELKDRGYFVSKVPKTVSGKTFEARTRQRKGGKYRFAVISCTQIGSKYQQMTHLYSFYELCRSRGIKEVLHCGDLVDGERMYRGQEYELFLHGADSQRSYVVENYPKAKGIRTRIISGNHDLAFYKTAGINLVEAVCKERADMEYLGDWLAFVDFNGIKVALMHGGGGVAYARSYKVQKIIEQMSPDMKPHMLFVGHWHVTDWLPMYRNVSGFTVGCFQSQTPYLAQKGLYPEVGGYIVEVTTDETGILETNVSWVPYYVHVKNDF